MPEVGARDGFLVIIKADELPFIDEVGFEEADVNAVQEWVQHQCKQGQCRWCDEGRPLQPFPDFA